MHLDYKKKYILKENNLSPSSVISTNLSTSKLLNLEINFVLLEYQKIL